jgi:hypothetical protein
MSHYKIRLVTNVGINHSVTPVSDLPVFSNAQPHKDLRRYTWSAFSANFHYPKEPSSLAKSPQITYSSRKRNKRSMVELSDRLKTPIAGRRIGNLFERSFPCRMSGHTTEACGPVKDSIPDSTSQVDRFARPMHRTDEVSGCREYRSWLMLIIRLRDKVCQTASTSWAMSTSARNRNAGI